MTRRVAIAGSDAARSRLLATLGENVALVDAPLADVLLVDARNVHDIVAALDETHGVPAIVLIDEPEADLTAMALRAGALGVLSRQSDVHELLAAIEGVALGLAVLDAPAREAVSGTALPALDARAEPLTAREVEILALLARGLTNKRIAARLNLSEHTVKFHVGSVLGKLGAATRAEAVALGARHGYVML